MLPPGQISPAIRHVLRKHKNVRVELAEVTGFDLDRRVVHARIAGVESLEVPYDSLIVAAGVSQSYFGHDEFSLYAPGMKTIDDAHELRRRIFGAFEMAEMTPDPVEKERWLTVAIVGAGPTGVELAGQVRDLACRSLRGEFRTFEPSSVRVILLDGGKEPLATFGDQLSGKVAKELEHLGVELRMGARVIGIDATGVDVADGEGNTTRLATYTTVWAAGVEASPLATELAKATGAELDRAGRIAVLPDCSVPGHPEVFVVGDMMALNNLPGVAEVAMQGGLHAANTIMRRLNGEPPHPLQVPRRRQRGRRRAVQGRRELPRAAPERVPGLGGLGVRPPNLPDRVRQPPDDVAQVDAFVHRQRSARAGVQRDAHRRRPQHPERGAVDHPTEPAPGLRPSTSSRRSGITPRPDLGTIAQMGGRSARRPD